MKVIMKTKENKILKIFNNYSDAAAYLGKVNGSANIGKAARGERHSAYGYLWALVEDDDPSIKLFNMRGGCSWNGGHLFNNQ